MLHYGYVPIPSSLCFQVLQTKNTASEVLNKSEPKGSQTNHTGVAHRLLLNPSIHVPEMSCSDVSTLTDDATACIVLFDLVYEN